MCSDTSARAGGAGRKTVSRSDLDELIRRYSNWGRWGEDDQLGTWNLVSDVHRRRALEAVRDGRSYSLALPLERNGPQPPFERRLNPQHQMLLTGTDLRAGLMPDADHGCGAADDMVTMALQCATHWDGLAHFFFDFHMYNGRPCELVDALGAHANGIEQARAEGFTRGVLIDVPRCRGARWAEPGEHLDVAGLEDALERQRVEVREGDVLLIRTGHLGRHQDRGEWEGYSHADAPGLGVDAVPWLHEHGVAGVASDTWAFEVMPSLGPVMLPFHAVGIVHLGLAVGESFVLDQLAEACAADGRYDFLFCGPPLPFTGAVGAPVNPIAVR